VTSLATVDKYDLTERAGQLDSSAMQEVTRGLRRVLGMAR
jgi:mRNA-degrading endonuclease toxin of MazEF toxin-antitoxin module